MLDSLPAFPLGANRLVFFLLLAFAVSAFSARALTRIALRIGLADLPGGRKQHHGAIPVTGGVAMFAGFAAASLISGLVAGPTLALVTALALMVAGGAADDMRDITPRSKFFLQLIAALLMTSWADVQVTQLGDLLGLRPVNLHGWAIPFSVVCALGMINAVNMLDGLDGAAGGVALVAALWMAWGAAAQGLGAQCVLLLLLAAAIAGFLVWNLRVPCRRQATVFMGDAGSMMLGLALCWFSIDLTQGAGRTLPPMACVWLLAVPLLDMARVMFLRLLRGKSLFGADRGHFHHILVARGHSVAAAAWILIGTSAVSGAIGAGAWKLGVPDWAMFYAFSALLAAILALSWTRELDKSVDDGADG
jgi:UDP-GlcNAc:undecaprenyl-phosphate/decaprenyl-phosphate GlcNAc-1-phosphate transferase